MAISLGRREFIAGLSGAAAWPFAASAQQRAMPVIGYLSFGSPEANASAEFGSPEEFLRRLKEAGYDEGRNVAIEFRWGNDQDESYDTRRLREFATDWVRR